MQDFRKLHVWMKSHAFVLELYRMTRGFPKEETYGTTAQLRRAAVSIPANIAEGAGRRTRADFARHLDVSPGSASEVQYFLLLAGDLMFLKGADCQRLVARVVELKRMLCSLASRLRASTDG